MVELELIVSNTVEHFVGKQENREVQLFFKLRSKPPLCILNFSPRYEFFVVSSCVSDFFVCACDR